MKTLTTLACLSLVAFLGACNSPTKTAAPGAVSGSSACCATKSAECTATMTSAPGAVSGAAATCTKGASSCSMSTAAPAAAPGAVSGKSGCCASKTTCSGK